MDFSTSPSVKNQENAGVFGLLTELCSKIATKYSVHNRVSHKHLLCKMRSHSYELILKKSNKDISRSHQEPIADLLTHYFISLKHTKNVAEYKRSVELKRIITKLRHSDFKEEKENVYAVLKFMMALKNSVEVDLSAEIFQSPFTFGAGEQMLPKLHRESFGSPQPYSYYPSHVFELPFSINQQETLMFCNGSKTYTEYTVESYDSRSFLPENTFSIAKPTDVKTFLSPMSLASMTSSHLSPYSDNANINYSRLIGPRDLQIPPTSTEPSEAANVSMYSVKTDVKEVFRAPMADNSVDIWELASQVDKDIPDDIWEVVSKMPPIEERRLIATSSREVGLWRQIYGDFLSELNVTPEKLFIRHIMYLLIGVETKSFPFSQESNYFYVKENLILEGISLEHIQRYVSDLLLVGTYYKRLFKFAFNETLEDHLHGNGLVFEAAREVVRRYLLEFRLTATEIYEKCCEQDTEDMNFMPTLLQILYHIKPLKYELDTIGSIYKIIQLEPKDSIPKGAELMSYLYNEISMISHKKTASTMYNALLSICSVYFKFIERFIFEGELDDRFYEFFIRKDSQYVNSRSKRYWDKGFHITQSVAVPEFLKSMAKCILLCGKSLRLLKLCNPGDPLVVLISSDHPSVKCCSSFEELERQQQVLDVYRTRCLFVSGEPATFEQILLKREAESKAFAEMASIKQAETLEKIVAERKRLAQLIIAEKQHSLRVLEAAMAEAKAVKNKSKQREKRISQLEHAAEKAAEEVDSRLRDDEKSKIMAYYSKLNMEVEKSKLHMEWKIKRLQLDQSRMQLLSSEKRNLKREKLELEHQKNEEIMSMSMRSDMDDYDAQSVNENDDKSADSKESQFLTGQEDSVISSEFELNKAKAQSSSVVFSSICSVAKSIFGGSKESTDKECDNKKVLDAQGNIVTEKADITRIQPVSKTSSDVIGGGLDNIFDNSEFLKSRQEALVNKQKVMAHEFGQIDIENNDVKTGTSINLQSVDEENNDVLSSTEEAKRNKLKVLGAEFDIIKPDVSYHPTEARTDAQKEAIVNKQKVLGVEYNLPSEAYIRKEPANFAQEEALKNKNKMLGSDYDLVSEPCSRQASTKRAALTLNLKPFSETAVGNYSLGVTPNTGAITPAEFFPRLDLETPTTAEIPVEGQVSSDLFTPRSEIEKDLIEDGSKKDKDFLSTQGFDFSIMVDEDNADSEANNYLQSGDSVDNSPTKSLYPVNKASAVNFLDGTYSLDDFDPFGTKQLTKYTNDYLSSKMSLEMASSCYTHPAIIMEEVQKKPYNNIFASHFSPKSEDEAKVKTDNIATLTACLQRSVMLPLKYQLEVVNNSILTYFLVDLDMYEHLRSLKDYFFLMDGEFSRSICHNLFIKLVKTINPQELLNFSTLHNILDKALGSSISHVHKFSENLSFTITESPLSFQHSSPDVLQCLSLTYSVSWPLNIILSQEALVRYAKVFQFLVKMRRISWVLSDDFECLKLSAKLSRKDSRKLLRSPQYISVQLYRHIMASLIRALDTYIVTTCILTSWTEFENDLKKAKTLDDLYECHVVYIKKVLFRCLLNNRSTPVMKLLNDIFTVILKFSRVLKAGEWHFNSSTCHYTHSNFAQLKELFHLFQKVTKYLHKVVTRLMECGYQRHLVELLTLVNLNGYYDPERSKEERSIQSP